MKRYWSVEVERLDKNGDRYYTNTRRYSSYENGKRAFERRIVPVNCSLLFEYADDYTARILAIRGNYAKCEQALVDQKIDIKGESFFNDRD